ncbi:MAG: BrnT family toxin [Planctomycetota bacterium]|nr:BrnT family toxin [Planctomycetota bacterium]
MNGLRFEWDPRKAAKNRRKHGVSFEEAATVFNDLRRLREYDLMHAGEEDREIVIGFSERMRLLMVVIYEQEENVIRIISARRATREEGLRYFAEG